MRHLEPGRAAGGVAAQRAVEIASSSESRTPAASLRMWVAYRASRRAAIATSAATSSGAAWTPGRIDEPARDPDRARVEGLLDVAAHGGELGSVGRPAVGTDHRPAHGAVADEQGDVRAERLPLDLVEVVAERRPGRVEPEIARGPASSIAGTAPSIGAYV